MKQQGVTVDLDTLVRLRPLAQGIELGARRQALSAQAGGYRSIYRGRGLEFDEVRLYQATDDARTIDWRVTARRGKPHTKLFREERERPIMLLVDLNPAMFFGSRRVFKSVLAMELASLMAWAALRCGDRIGGVISTAGGHYELPPRPRRAGAQALLHTMVTHQPTAAGVAKAGHLDQALARLKRVTHPGSLVMILSDFMTLGAEGEHYLAALSKHNDLMTGLIFDPLEADAPPPGRYHFGNTRQTLTLDTSSPANRHFWQQHFEQRRYHIQRMSQRHKLHFMPLCTQDQPVIALQQGLAGKTTHTSRPRRSSNE